MSKCRELIRTETRLLPTPAVAGWNETTREQKAAEVRGEFIRGGGKIIRQDRIRNPAFDKRQHKDDRSTFRFVVEYRLTEEPQP